MSWPAIGRGEVTALKQAIAEAAARDADVAAFYRGTTFEPIWVGATPEHAERRAQLMRFLADAPMHGLPADRYNMAYLRAQMAAAATSRDMGQLEVTLSQVFLQYALDVQTGLLIPSRVDKEIVREVPYRDRSSTLVKFAGSDPTDFFQTLPPQTVEYTALRKERLRLMADLARGGWGPTVPVRTLERGDTGASVAKLRDRLRAMGYLSRSSTQTFDQDIEAAVHAFQLAHGLDADGVAGEGTLREINVSIEKRLQAITVAMERERWMNRPRGDRHILVNLPDFTAKVIDHGEVTFVTRSVVGAARDGKLTPEFSDVMEHMVINPSWYVPRSIIARDYLPKLRANPHAASYLEITDSRGRVVRRGSVSFAGYTARTFPYAIRQPPGPKNALGLVKFMFPNKHNIYLHDTPAKNLFGREVRAYSSGCIRLADPFDFAYTLLSRQSETPKADFHKVLDTGQETYVYLDNPVPVHIIYRTAFADNKGRVQFRRDFYGRDARIWQALSNAGVALSGVQG